MKLSLDLNLAHELRNKFNEQLTFSISKTAAFSQKGKTPKNSASQPSLQNAFNATCAVLNRIDSLAAHCCSLDMGLPDSNNSVFAFCDLLNYGQTLIDCIELIAMIYDCTFSNRTDCSCFLQPGKDGKGSDEKYFKYLRSLCTIHPVNTSYYLKDYQDDVLEWCPAVFSVHDQEALLLFNIYPEIKNADFVAIVYRNDMESFKCIPIFTEQVFSYLKKRYNQIQDVIMAIDAYNKMATQKLKNTKILAFNNFPNYDDYLHALDHEIKTRYS